MLFGNAKNFTYYARNHANYVGCNCFIYFNFSKIKLSGVGRQFLLGGGGGGKGRQVNTSLHS